MKRLYRIVICCVILCFPWTHAVQASTTITATIFPLYEIARIIAPGARIHLLIPPGISPHHFEPSFKDFRWLYESDLILGVGTESWLLKNPELAAKSLLLSGGRPVENPHLWLDLDLLSQFAENLARRLAQLEPEKAPLYEQNKSLILRNITSLKRELRTLSECSRKREVIIIGHAALQKFLREAGLREIALAGPHPESEVPPEKLKKILTLVREKHIRVAFLLDPVFRKYALIFKNEADIEILTLNPGLPLFKEDRHLSFFELLHKNIVNLRKGLCR
ncbi:metal ABC transporter solute-binding protein, Zn/Mn family [Thermosulfurimonas sp. F29]|uniref:metal ABC transporter solute-binding protein, Zn/Mn family n=1 Tax=Thermosulfurimonas sp. F29 TaxID=2867247 RepID=UPI001C83D9A9|nr:zinc ABC transporter substrate-binding protein [Thermosulfurimonas sp. F29]MBX6422863.1 zinc ABC transporter substrate-binding protein [Thermosulfurimonas sp. F29]